MILSFRGIIVAVKPFMNESLKGEDFLKSYHTIIKGSCTGVGNQKIAVPILDKHSSLKPLQIVGCIH